MSDVNNEDTPQEESEKKQYWTVRAPEPNYSGMAGAIEFKDGVAILERADTAEWFRRAGYDVTKGGEPLPDGPPPSVAPPRYGEAPWSHDAAVEGKAAEGLRSDAFLPPVGAGEGKDPHGEQVVSPGIHAEDVTPVAPGSVSSVPEEQEAKESELAERVLIDGEEVQNVTGADWKEQEEVKTEGDETEVQQPADGVTGELGLSDPGSAEVGATGQVNDAADPEGKGGVVEAPAANASKAEWVDFAVTQGAAREDAERATRNQLVEQFGNKNG